MRHRFAVVTLRIARERFNGSMEVGHTRHDPMRQRRVMTRTNVWGPSFFGVLRQAAKFQAHEKTKIDGVRAARVPTRIQWFRGTERAATRRSETGGS
jgi:hypothetical protein